MDLSRFEHVELLPRAAEYRAVIDDLTERRGWEIAAAVTTLFIEGTPFERGELDASAPKRPEAPLERHPLVVHYALPVESLALTKAHRQVEGSHRQSAWSIILDHVGVGSRGPVVDGMRRMLTAWKAYRDDVASACGLSR
jgi:pyrroloquinoline-quinone synthase